MPVLALAQVPHVQRVTVLAGEQQFGIQTVLDHVRRAPLARDHGVVTEVPREVVGEILRPAIELPLAANVERFRIEDEDAAGAVAVRRADRVQVDAVRTAVRGVHATVPGPLRNGVSIDDLGDFELPRVGFGVDDMQARRAQARHDEIPALHVRVRRVRTQAGAAGVPAEVVEFVARTRHVQLTHELPVASSTRDPRRRRPSRRADPGGDSSGRRRRGFRAAPPWPSAGKGRTSDRVATAASRAPV